MLWAVCALLLAPVPSRAGVVAARPGWTVDRVRFEPLDAPLGVAGVGDYKGVLELARAGGGVAVVDEVGLDDYVKGISEVPVSWPAEAQKAQAIAARTYALWQMQRRPAGAAADICPTQACQVYAGLAKERRPGAEAWTSAVEATSGQVLLWRGGPIVAKYSSTNGGRSIAGGQPYLRAVEDRDDAVSPYHRWQAVLPLATLADIFAPPGQLTGVTRVGDSVVFDWTSPDPITSEPVPGQMTVPAADFRSRVNGAVPAPAGLPLTLPSVRFDMGSDGAAAVAHGRGWGHGIGMSQYGALGKALRGMKAPEILAAYYAGLRPVTVPAGQLPTTIRVLVDPGRASAEVTSAGRFRVVDGTGAVLAVAGSGSWEVVPAGKGVRVVPPADQAGAPSLDGLRLDQAVAPLGETSVLHFTLAAPAALRVTVHLPAAPPVVMELGVKEAGAQAVEVPAAARPGPASVTVRADAGGGRTAEMPITFQVARLSAGGMPGGQQLAAVDRLVAPPSTDAWLQVTALVLLLTTAAGLARTGRQLH